MKTMNKLARRGWWAAMIHQGTLSLILTLDDFLISGPHLITDGEDSLSSSDPNIFYVGSSDSVERSYSEHHLTVSTYYVLRPYIRGILYGLSPLYQISLYVPCKTQDQMELYRDLISKIDIGGHFFQDRIYWDFEALKKDIMDTRLACLIYSGGFSLDSDWLRKISIESKPFLATKDVDLTKSENLFDLIEMRGFLEDVHQRYLSLVKESRKIYFADMIRLHVDEKGRQGSGNCEISNTSGFYSTTNEQSKRRYPKPFLSDRHSVKWKNKKEFSVFKASDKSPLSWGVLNMNALLEEYEDIIQEQLEIGHDINYASYGQSSFTKSLCRWNTITQRKSDILKILMNHSDKAHIHEKLKDLNTLYCLKKCQSENDMLTGSARSLKSSISTESANSGYLVISDKYDPANNLDPMAQFTTWYTKDIKLV